MHSRRSMPSLRPRRRQRPIRPLRLQSASSLLCKGSGCCRVRRHARLRYTPSVTHAPCTPHRHPSGIHCSCALACALAVLKSQVDKSGAELAALQQQLAAKDAQAVQLAADLASAKESAASQPSSEPSSDASAGRVLELEQKVAELEKAVKVRRSSQKALCNASRCKSSEPQRSLRRACAAKAAGSCTQTLQLHGRPRQTSSARSRQSSRHWRRSTTTFWSCSQMAGPAKVRLRDHMSTSAVPPQRDHRREWCRHSDSVSHGIPFGLQMWIWTSMRKANQ
jgi:hypothetical protein